MYLKDGIKIHPRQTRQFFKKDNDDKRLTIRPTLEQMRKYNIEHFKGKQFRYIKFLCSKVEKKKLLKECLVDLYLRNPKDNNLEWRKKDITTGKWIKSDKPNYITDFNSLDQSKGGILC